MKHYLIAIAALAIAAVPAYAVTQGVAGYLDQIANEQVAESFDYASCDVIAEDLEHADYDYWREIEQTPEGRWCIRA